VKLSRVLPYILTATLVGAACTNGVLSGSTDGSGSSGCPAGSSASTPGFLDSSLNQGTGIAGAPTINAIAVQSDGKILVGGTFTSYNGTGRVNLVRINSDGTIDSTFSIGTGFNGVVTAIFPLANGKIIVGGGFTLYNGSGRGGIVRLNSDGTLDGSFGTSTGANGVVSTIAQQSTGDLLLGGTFTTYEGTAQNNVARAFLSNGLNDGAMLTSGGTGGTGAVNAIVVLPTDNFIVAGAFTSWEGSGRNRIAKAFAGNGNNDATFGSTGANNTVSALALQPDGKIVLGGAFGTYEGTARNRLARANSDGTIDLSFSPGVGPNSGVNTIALLPDGKFLVGGNFTLYNGSANGGIVRLNSDGSFDSTFNPGGAGVTGGGAFVNTIVTASLKCSVIAYFGGSFTAFDSFALGYFGRMFR
jgi:uncharacterized delta-60 repeat protein